VRKESQSKWEDEGFIKVIQGGPFGASGSNEQSAGKDVGRRLDLMGRKPCRTGLMSVYAPRSDMLRWTTVLYTTFCLIE